MADGDDSLEDASSEEDEDYDYMTTVPLMEGVKDRSML